MQKRCLLLVLTLALFIVVQGCSLLIPQSKVEIEIQSINTSWSYDILTVYFRVTNHSKQTLPGITVFFTVDFWLTETQEYVPIKFEGFVAPGIPPGKSNMTISKLIDYELNNAEIDKTKTKVRVRRILIL